VGALTWDGHLSVAVTWDPVLLPDGERFAELIGPAFDALAAAATADDEPRPRDPGED
jgi:hypothetical protein